MAKLVMIDSRNEKLLSDFIHPFSPGFFQRNLVTCRHKKVWN